jgi:hypothetical protein
VQIKYWVGLTFGNTGSFFFIGGLFRCLPLQIRISLGWFGDAMGIHLNFRGGLLIGIRL